MKLVLIALPFVLLACGSREDVVSTFTYGQDANTTSVDPTVVVDASNDTSDDVADGSVVDTDVVDSSVGDSSVGDSSDDTSVDSGSDASNDSDNVSDAEYHNDAHRCNRNHNN
jgi:hypothetical protein